MLSQDTVSQEPLGICIASLAQSANDVTHDYGSLRTIDDFAFPTTMTSTRLDSMKQLQGTQYGVLGRRQ